MNCFAECNTRNRMSTVLPRWLYPGDINKYLTMPTDSNILRHKVATLHNSQRC